MNKLSSGVDILDQLESMYDPKYQENLLIVDRALEQAKGFTTLNDISEPRTELDAKLLELIDSVAMG